MKSVAIFRHAKTEGPGYLATFLDARQIPWELIKVDEGDQLPKLAHAFSGLVFMGGPMSVNDDLPWIPPVLDLIRQAVAQDIPVLGHCLGGQLMAKALGGSVAANPVKEIGWGDVQVDSHSAAWHWFGEMAGFNSFHWHGETFQLPPQATHLLSSQFCKNQAFSIADMHLGFQCHIEMTEDMVKTWCDNGGSEVRESCVSPGVQMVDEIQRDLPLRVSALNQVADSVYQVWIRGLKA